MIRGLIGEARAEELRSRGAVATAQNILDTKLGKQPAFRGEEARWQEWYFKFRAYILFMGGHYPDLVAAVEVGERPDLDAVRGRACRHRRVVHDAQGERKRWQG